MKPDLYTKAVLTVIAVCLMAIVARNMELIPTAKAGDWTAPAYATVPLNEDGSMNVRVVEVPQTIDVNLVYSSARVDVNLKRCDECPLSVNVQ